MQDRSGNTGKPSPLDRFGERRRRDVSRKFSSQTFRFLREVLDKLNSGGRESDWFDRFAAKRIRDELLPLATLVSSVVIRASVSLDCSLWAITRRVLVSLDKRGDLCGLFLANSRKRYLFVVFQSDPVILRTFFYCLFLLSRSSA